MSQREFADAAGLSVRAIRDLERGATGRPQPTTVRALVRGLSLSPSEARLLEDAGRQVSADRLRPRTGSGRPIPAFATPLIGREPDVAAVCRLLCRPGTRLVTITGPAGIGKTRVAAEVARRVADAFDGFASVDLAGTGGTGASHAGTGRANTVAPAVSAVLPAGRMAASAGGRWLVLLDGFDHGDTAAAELAALLAGDGRVRLLVTARDPLRLRAEHLWPLGPLSVPAPGVRPDTGDVDRFSGLALLARLGGEVRSGFTLDPGDVATAAELVRRVGGNPLAIELTAVRLRTQDLAEVDAGLANELTGADHPDEVLRRVILDRLRALPGWVAARLAVLGQLSGAVTPEVLRRALAERGLSTELLDASVALLAAARLVQVTDNSGSVRLDVAPAVREAVSVHVGVIGPPVETRCDGSEP